MPRWAIVFFAWILCCTSALRGAIEPDEVEVSIITMGPGPMVYERFGHIAIRLRIPSAGPDVLYDWGNFDFGEPNFIGKFVKGSLLYSMDTKPTDRWLEFYQLTQDRAITEQLLSLDAGQKRKLFDLLIENERNPKYLYDYYLDNCSTRVRDILDKSVDGQFAPQWTAATPNSFRWHTRRLMDVGVDNKAMSLLIDLCCGRKVDHPLSQWEAAFIPMELSNLLDAAQINHADGTRSPLVKERRELNRTTFPGNAEPAESRSTVRYALPIGLVLGAVMFAAAKFFRIGFWVLAGLWSAFASFGTVFFIVIICFTRHWVVDWNENFLQFSPVSIGILAGVLVPRLRKLLRWLPLIAFGLSVLGLAITISHLTIQQTAPAVCLALPAHLALLLGWNTRKAGTVAEPARKLPIESLKDSNE